MQIKNVEILRTQEGNLYTNGLNQDFNFELFLKHFESYDNEIYLLNYIIDYVIDENKNLQNGETMSFGLWLIKFQLEKGYLCIYELDEDFNSWILGADNAIYYYNMQKTMCNNENTDFQLPLLNQMIAISDGVLDGNIVNGIRYSEPAHMSGWYITSEQYSGNVRDIKVVSIQEICRYRKDLLQFLALPPGYAFRTDLDYTCSVWKTNSLTNDINSN